MMDDRVEEWLNAATHALGAVASLVGGVFLISLASRFGDTSTIVSVAIYSVSLVLLYGASTFYHAARRETLKARLQVLDHCAIYVLIAGSYTPFALGPLRGVWGYLSLVLVWSIAAIGIHRRRCAGEEFDRMSPKSYLLMGWICVIPFLPALRELSVQTLILIVLGGIAYMAGTIFYESRRIPYAHPIWHGFVLAGSTAHFAAVLVELT